MVPEEALQLERGAEVSGVDVYRGPGAGAIGHQRVDAKALHSLEVPAVIAPCDLLLEAISALGALHVAAAEIEAREAENRVLRSHNASVSSDNLAVHGRVFNNFRVRRSRDANTGVFPRSRPRHAEE